MTTRTKSFSLTLIILLTILAIAVLKSINHIQTAAMDKQRIEDVEYIRAGVRASYPGLISDDYDENEKLSLINELILKDFNKILQLYSFNPYPEPPSGALSDGKTATILNITYQIMLNNPKYISIYYLASYSAPFAAHPTNLVYSTNIDKSRGQRLALGDLVNLEIAFADSLRGKKPVNEEQYPEYIKQGIAAYLSALSSEELLEGMRTADIIGAKNRMNIYSYMTADSLGISIGLPNYLGDHIELEADYDSLKPYLKSDFQPVY